MIQTAAEMTSVTFTVAATGSPAPTFQWFRNGVTFPGWTGVTLTVEGLSSNDTGTYVAVATNSAGSATSSAATLALSTPATGNTGNTSGTVSDPSTGNNNPTNPAPVFTTQPLSQTAAPLTSVTFTVAVSGSPAPTIQWFRDGFTFGGWTGPTLVVEGLSTNDAGTYVAVATNSAGSTTSAPAMLTIAGSSTPATSAPTFTLQPVSQTAAPLTTVTFTAAASGTPEPTIQWFRNGITFPSWTGPTLIVEGLSSNDIGTYVAVATNSAGTQKSTAATLTLATELAGSVTSKTTVTTVAAARAASTVSTSDSAAPTSSAAADSRLVNLSVRAEAGNGDESLIVGFVIAGNSDKSLLIRGSGPALGAFGVAGALVDPTLSLYSGARLLAANDDWSTAADAAAIAPASRRVGAFALPEAGRDAALLTNISSGVYTGQISGKDAASGTALIELYDAAPEASARLVNVSVRTVVKTSGAAPAIGFVVAGSAPKKLLLRAVGPSLAGFGITDPLKDPQLSIYEAGAARQENDDWSGAAELDAAFAQVGAFPLRDTASKDAALIFTAAPGAYTAVVSGLNSATGTVLVEVYELP